MALAKASHLQWPEPVVRVQLLSESGIVDIPRNYIRPLSERQAAPSASAAGEELRIPVVDLERPGDPATLAAVAAACKEWGFFQVVNHGVPPELMRAAREAWKGFFRQPMADKERYASSPQTYEGYSSRLGVEKDAILDWDDWFLLRVKPPSIRSPDCYWPDKPLPCRQLTEEYCSEVIKLGQLLLKVISASLGLDEGYLQRAFGGDDDSVALFRVNYYPRCPQPDLTLGFSPHSDPGGITILLADERVGGLQVRHGEEWVTVKPIPDAFVINIADQVQIMTNAIYKSVEHRVTANLECERMSLVVFYSPRGDLPVAPAEELVTEERPALYKPMTYNEYRLHIVTKGPTGKAQVESLKAQPASTQDN